MSAPVSLSLMPLSLKKKPNLSSIISLCRLSSIGRLLSTDMVDKYFFCTRLSSKLTRTHVFFGSIIIFFFFNTFGCCDPTIIPAATYAASTYIAGKPTLTLSSSNRSTNFSFNMYSCFLQIVKFGNAHTAYFPSFGNWIRSFIFRNLSIVNPVNEVSSVAL